MRRLLATTTTIAACLALTAPAAHAEPDPSPPPDTPQEAVCVAAHGGATGAGDALGAPWLAPATDQLAETTLCPAPSDPNPEPEPEPEPEYWNPLCTAVEEAARHWDTVGGPPEFSDGFRQMADGMGCEHSAPPPEFDPEFVRQQLCHAFRTLAEGFGSDNPFSDGFGQLADGCEGSDDPPDPDPGPTPPPSTPYEVPCYVAHEFANGWEDNGGPPEMSDATREFADHTVCYDFGDPVGELARVVVDEVACQIAYEIADAVTGTPFEPVAEPFRQLTEQLQCPPPKPDPDPEPDPDPDPEPEPGWNPFCAPLDEAARQWDGAGGPPEFSDIFRHMYDGMNCAESGPPPEFGDPREPLCFVLHEFANEFEEHGGDNPFTTALRTLADTLACPSSP